MKALFLGGTGTISAAISELAAGMGIELWLLNRGNRSEFVPEGARVICADIGDEAQVKAAIAGQKFDVVADFIAYTPDQVARDIRLFEGICGQYLFISSASAYQKPPASPVITESTPLSNPYWQYSRDKIACEDLLMEAYRARQFPVTIVRPSHTYGKTSVPTGLHGRQGSYSVIERIVRGKPVIVHGDGTSLWTMTYNADFAKAFVGLMGNPHAIGEAYHITSDESLTWDQIYRIIGGALGVEPKLLHVPSDLLAKMSPNWLGALIGDKANSVIFDNAKIKRAVPGFAATTRFDQGVRIALDYIGAHPALQKQDPEFDRWCDRLAGDYRLIVSDLPKY